MRGHRAMSALCQTGDITTVPFGELSARHLAVSHSPDSNREPHLPHREAIEESIAARSDQVRLAARAGRVGSIPGTRSRHIGLHILGTGDGRITLAIRMPKHGDAGAAAGPVLTRKIHVGGIGSPVLVRPGEDV